MTSWERREAARYATACVLVLVLLVAMAWLGGIETA